MNDKKQFYEDLKLKREEGGFSLDEISDFTKIDIRYLIAVEEGDFSCLPAVYMRLFIRSYCEYIGADSKKALNDYEFLNIIRQNISRLNTTIRWYKPNWRGPSSFFNCCM